MPYLAYFKLLLSKLKINRCKAINKLFGFNLKKKGFENNVASLTRAHAIDSFECHSLFKIGINNSAFSNLNHISDRKF